MIITAKGGSNADDYLSLKPAKQNVDVEETAATKIDFYHKQELNSEQNFHMEGVKIQLANKKVEHKSMKGKKSSQRYVDPNVAPESITCQENDIINYLNKFGLLEEHGQINIKSIIPSTELYEDEKIGH
jgi:hypothetical protein